jgi:hypothetical protein
MKAHLNLYVIKFVSACSLGSFLTPADLNSTQHCSNARLALPYLLAKASNRWKKPCSPDATDDAGLAAVCGAPATLPLAAAVMTGALAEVTALSLEGWRGWEEGGCAPAAAAATPRAYARSASAAADPPAPCGASDPLLDARCDRAGDRSRPPPPLAAAAAADSALPLLEGRGSRAAVAASSPATVDVMDGGSLGGAASTGSPSRNAMSAQGVMVRARSAPIPALSPGTTSAQPPDSRPAASLSRSAGPSAAAS